MKIYLFILLLLAGGLKGYSQYTLPYFEDFEQAPAVQLYGNQLNLNWAPHIQIFTVAQGRMQTDVLPEYMPSGKRAITLDQPGVNLVQNDLVLRLDLRNYSNDELEIFFDWTDFGEQPSPGDGVWVRGNANHTWTLLYDLSSRLYSFPDGYWRFSGYLDLDSALRTVGTSVDSTFELRMGQNGGSTQNTVLTGGGISWDNIGIQKVTRNDASIHQVLPFCQGSSPVKVILKNKGSDTLTSATVAWAVNGSPQPELRLSGLHLLKEEDTVITLGNFNFSGSSPYTIEAHIDSVNQGMDLQHSNDTSRWFQATSSLSGSYTVGAGGDFPHPDSALKELQIRGSCGPVTLLLMDSVFQHQISFEDFPKASPTDTLRITSHPANARPSTLMGTLFFRGLDAVRIDHLKITASDSLIHFLHPTQQVEIDHNQFESLDTNQSWAKGIANTLYIQVDHLSIHHNVFNQVENPVAMRGFHSPAFYLASHWAIDSNEINQFRGQGLQLRNVHTLQVNGNKLSTAQSFSGGIYLTYGTKVQISGNKVHLSQPSLLLSLSNCNSTGRNQTDSIFIAHNSFCGSNALGEGLGNGVRIEHTEFGRFVHNSVYCFSDAFRTNSVGHFQIANNVWEVEDQQYVRSEVGNKYFIDNRNNAYWAKSSTWKGVDPGVYDASAIFDNPWFEDPAKGNLLPGNPALDSSGASIHGIQWDILGQPYTPGFLDIGAYSFTPCSHDIQLQSFYSEYNFVPLSQRAHLQAQIQSSGKDSVHQVHWFLNQTGSIHQRNLGSLSSRQQRKVDTLISGPSSATMGQWTAWVNTSSADCRLYNDTLTTRVNWSDSALSRPMDTLNPLYFSLINRLGQEFYLTDKDTLTGIGIYLRSYFPFAAQVEIWEANAMGHPGTRVDTSRTQQFGTLMHPTESHFSMRCGGLALDTGKFFVVLKLVNGPRPEILAGSRLIPDRTIIVNWDSLNQTPQYSNEIQHQRMALAMTAYLGTSRFRQKSVIDQDSSGFCWGDTAHLQVNSNHYTHWKWSTGHTTPQAWTTQPGWHSVTLLDSNHCPFSDSIYVDRHPTPNFSLHLPALLCFNDTGQIRAQVSQGSPPFTYFWNGPSAPTTPQMNGAGEGSYSLLIKDSMKCEYDTIFQLAAPDSIELLFSNPIDKGTANELSVSSKGGTRPFQSWVWNNGEQDSTALQLPYEWAVVTVTDGNGCQMKDSINLAYPMGIVESEVSSQVIMYPNPSTGKLQLKEWVPSLQIWTVSIFSLSGQSLIKQKWDPQSESLLILDLTRLNPGSYWVTLQSSSQFQASPLILK
ncbi:T9SS type A sorting domain-containing protein [bacterium SCSIO 12741]|nr:T9SS type A sorting domain-containing protein [bacterium SCSIO 12741]